MPTPNDSKNKVFGFSEQYAIGADGEEFLDRYYENFFDIKPVTDHELQRRGVDRHFREKQNCAAWFTVEYKVDFRAGKTGNVFVETKIDCDGKREPGWARKLSAQALLYYIPAHGLCYFCSALHFKRRISAWSTSCRESPPVVSSEGDKTWSATGLLVPIQRFAADCAISVDNIRAFNAP